jgi:hypothetical protein
MLLYAACTRGCGRSDRVRFFFSRVSSPFQLLLGIVSHLDYPSSAVPCAYHLERHTFTRYAMTAPAHCAVNEILVEPTGAPM